MESTDSCSVGKALEDECHKLTYTRIKQLLNFNTIKEEEKILPKWRSGLRHFDALETVCMHHYKSFMGNAFEKKYSKCCDIFKKHAKKVKANHKVTVAMAEELEMQSINVTPGWKLCATCYQKVKKLMLVDSVKAVLKAVLSAVAPTVMKKLDRQSAKHCFEDTLDACQVSPIVTHGVPKKQRKVHVKKKIQVVQRLEDAFNTSIGETLSYHEEQTECSKCELNAYIRSIDAWSNL